MRPEGVSVELELSQDGYERLCRLAERTARAGGNPSFENLIGVAVATGVSALEELLDRAERELRQGLHS